VKCHTGSCGNPAQEESSGIASVVSKRAMDKEKLDALFVLAGQA
jgi:hypothetical protein